MNRMEMTDINGIYLNDTKIDQNTSWEDLVNKQDSKCDVIKIAFGMGDKPSIEAMSKSNINFVKIKRFRNNHYKGYKNGKRIMQWQTTDDAPIVPSGVYNVEIGW